MKFDPPLQQGRLLRRYKRFLADVALPDGRELTLHCPNTGSMLGCCEPGSRVWFRDSGQAGRKYPCTWELLETAEGDLVCVNTGRANGLVEEAVRLGTIAELRGYASLRREVRYGQEGSRIDLCLEDPERPPCFIEVKNVTLNQQGTGYFPDAVSVRGQKHLRELALVRASGARAVLLFCVAHTGVREVRPADHIDPEYGRLMRQAAAAGVELLAYQADISSEEIRLARPLPVILPPQAE